MGPLLLLVLLKLLIVAMVLGWGSEAPRTFPCVGRGTCDPKGLWSRRTLW